MQAGQGKAKDGEGEGEGEGSTHDNGTIDPRLKLCLLRAAVGGRGRTGAWEYVHIPPPPPPLILALREIPQKVRRAIQYHHPSKPDGLRRLSSFATVLSHIVHTPTHPHPHQRFSLSHHPIQTLLVWMRVSLCSVWLCITGRLALTYLGFLFDTHGQEQEGCHSSYHCLGLPWMAVIHRIDSMGHALTNTHTSHVPTRCVNVRGSERDV